MSDLRKFWGTIKRRSFYNNAERLNFQASAVHPWALMSFYLYAYICCSIQWMTAAVLKKAPLQGRQTDRQSIRFHSIGMSV